MKHTIKEIWDVMPKRFQGTVFGALLFFLAMASSELINLIHTDVFWIDFSVAILYVIIILRLTGIIYPWLINKQ